MVHIDIATLRRFPIIGVLLGFGSAIVVSFALREGWQEARTLIPQRAPEAHSLHDTVRLDHTRWVTVTDGAWHCEQAYTTERRGTIERWLRGPIDATEIPVTGVNDAELLVARVDGAVDCARQTRAPLTGVVSSVAIFTSREALARWGEGGKRVAVINVGATPTHALIMLLVLCAIVLLGFGTGVYFLSLMVRRRTERHSAPTHTGGPIEPS